MKVGIPKEIKNHEYRVGATPDVVQALVSQGHQVVVQKDAGAKSGFTDAQYQKAGAQIVGSAEEAYDAEMVVKVKEPQPAEFPLLKEGQILFGYLHLSAEKELTEALMRQRVVAIAYETITDADGGLPLLLPMSQIAGRVSIQVGASLLQINNGGKGVLLAGVPGVSSAKVLVIGGGVSGTEAARMAMGLGAQVVVLDKSLKRLAKLDSLFGPRLRTVYSTREAIEEEIAAADLVIGAVLIPGTKAPKLITRDMLRKMEIGSVFIDISIDQGGCAETSKPTTHHNPTYVEEGVTHYCVTNIPGSCARTASLALNHASMDYTLLLARRGWRAALQENAHLRNGLNVCLGKVAYQAVAHDLGFSYTSPEELLT